VQPFLFNGFKKTQLSFLKPLYFFSGFFSKKLAVRGRICYGKASIKKCLPKAYYLPDLSVYLSDYCRNSDNRVNRFFFCEKRRFMMRCVPRYLLEKVIKKAVVEGEKKEIAGNQVYFPSGKFERGCFEGMRHVAKVSNVKELQKAMQNKNVREIYVYRDRDLDRRNLTRILEENDLGKTIYCGFNFDS